MFCREWRQQILILSLLTAAVAATIGFASAAYTTTPVPDNAEFGAGSHFLRFGASDSDVLKADVAAAESVFEVLEVIYHREVAAPGLFEPLDYRAQDPSGPLGGPRLALVEGRYPDGNQVAITDGIANLLSLSIGESVALDGVTRRVVGVVENPGDLGDEFVLVPPVRNDHADSVTILLNTSDAEALSFRPPSGAGIDIGSRLTHEDVIAAVSILVLATIGLLFVALIAAASFIVIAQRRMRQLGVLAAVGATEKQLRLVTLINGSVVGLAAGAVGAAIGFGGWVALSPRIEDAVGYRVDALDVPFWVHATGVLLAVAASTAAAWWPARNVARVSAVRALSGRPPEPTPARRAGALAGAAAGIGVACLVLGGDVADATAVNWTNGALLVTGVVAVTLGVLITCPLAIRVLAACVGLFPLAVRLAVGELARYRARSGAALAAISLAIGAAVTIVAATAATQNPDDSGNLADNHLLIRAAHLDGPFIPDAVEIAGFQAEVDQLVAELDNPRVTQLEVALDPATVPDPSFNGRMAISIGARSGDGWADVSLLYVATPDLLAHYGYDLDAAPRDAEVITREIGEFAILGEVKSRTGPQMLAHAALLEPSYGSLPGSFITTEALSAHGWVAAPAGRWLVETAPPSSEQIASVRDIAASAGLTVEVRDRQSGLRALQLGSTTAGMLLALGVVAMTVGLVRSEAGRDVRVLAATGASRRTRRALTTTTAGALAVLGVILGAGGSYVGLSAGFAHNLGALSPVPLGHLVTIVLGMPLVAIAGGWLASGRSEPDVARQPIE